MEALQRKKVLILTMGMSHSKRRDTITSQLYLNLDKLPKYILAILCSFIIVLAASCNKIVTPKLLTNNRIQGDIAVYAKKGQIPILIENDKVFYCNLSCTQNLATFVFQGKIIDYCYLGTLEWETFELFFILYIDNKGRNNLALIQYNGSKPSIIFDIPTSADKLVNICSYFTKKTPVLICQSIDNKTVYTYNIKGKCLNITVLNTPVLFDTFISSYKNIYSLYGFDGSHIMFYNFDNNGLVVIRNIDTNSNKPIDQVILGQRKCTSYIDFITQILPVNNGEEIYFIDTLNYRIIDKCANVGFSKPVFYKFFINDDGFYVLSRCNDKLVLELLHKGSFTILNYFDDSSVVYKDNKTNIVYYFIYDMIDGKTISRKVLYNIDDNILYSSPYRLYFYLYTRNNSYIVNQHEIR
jgi:hypothetical protein